MLSTHIARTALRHSEEPLVNIAARIGYLSDTAFSIAFKRWSGQSPGRYRAEGRRVAEAVSGTADHTTRATVSSGSRAVDQMQAANLNVPR